MCQTGQGHWSLLQSGPDHLQRRHNLHPPWHRHKQKKNHRAATPTELKTFIWQHQLTPDTHTALPWPCSTSRLIKIVAGIRGVGTTRRESHSFCSSVCVFLYVCVYVRWDGRDESEIEGGEVRGGTHPLNPPLLTREQRDSAEWSTANWINWSITSHLSGGTEAPFKKTEQPRLNYAGGDHWSNHTEGCQSSPNFITCPWHVFMSQHHGRGQWGEMSMF